MKSLLVFLTLSTILTYDLIHEVGTYPEIKLPCTTMDKQNDESHILGGR